MYINISLRRNGCAPSAKCTHTIFKKSKHMKRAMGYVIHPLLLGHLQILEVSLAVFKYMLSNLYLIECILFINA